MKAPYMNDSDRDLSNLTKDAGILALGRNLQRHKSPSSPKLRAQQRCQT